MMQQAEATLGHLARGTCALQCWLLSFRQKWQRGPNRNCDVSEPMFFKFSEALQIFIPKKARPEDCTQVTREPLDTSTLGCKNTDNKTIAGICNFQLRSSVAAGVSRLQRGFTYRRQFCENIVLLDGAARRFSMMDDAFFPCFAFYDYDTAFPTSSQRFLFMLLTLVGVPQGFLNVHAGLFSLVMAVCLDVLGAARLLSFITSGVVQGCPLSGLLFALASDPMLNCFDERLVSGGEALVVACADDIGMAVKSIELLTIAAEIVSKPAKCTLVHVSVVLPTAFGG